MREDFENDDSQDIDIDYEGRYGRSSFADHKRRKRMRRRRKALIQNLIYLGMVALLGLFIYLTIVEIKSHQKPPVIDTQSIAPVVASQTEETTTETEQQTEESIGVGMTLPDEHGYYDVGDAKILDGFTAETNDNTAFLGDGLFNSEYIVVIDESTNQVVATRNANTVINPASMTKILTILVAAEHISDLDEIVSIPKEATDFSYLNECSAVGFYDEEQVPVRDLFYGTILPSGADAAYSLAMYTAGSHEVFVELMNEKVAELGLSDTAHFANAVGIYDENNCCTVTDMAMILKAAVENDWCREVLSTRRYTTAQTEQNPDGVFITNSFLISTDNQEVTGQIVGAKTGYVEESRHCAASYYISETGKPYICVTATSMKRELTVEDHVKLYNTYAQ